MKLSLNMPDALYDKYLAKYGSPGHYKAMLTAIEKFEAIPNGDRYLIISGDARKRIEAVFQVPMESPEMLAKNLEKLNRVRIGGIDMEFTPEELARIDMQATFHGRTRQQFISEMLTEIKDRMLERV